jgi:hypothetical protein
MSIINNLFLDRFDNWSFSQYNQPTLGVTIWIIRINVEDYASIFEIVWHMSLPNQVCIHYPID